MLQDTGCYKLPLPTVTFQVVTFKSSGEQARRNLTYFKLKYTSEISPQTIADLYKPSSSFLKYV